jgi:hypothetical protein
VGLQPRWAGLGWAVGLQPRWAGWAGLDGLDGLAGLGWMGWSWRQNGARNTIQMITPTSIEESVADKAKFLVELRINMEKEYADAHDDHLRCFSRTRCAELNMT